MRIYCMIAQTRRQLQDLGPIPDELITELKGRGHEVTCAFAEDLSLPLNDIRNDHDVYLLKAHDNLWLSVAAILHEKGARIINSYPASICAENKITAINRLASHGIPVPASWFTASPEHIRALVMKHPILIKPHIGGMGSSSRITRVENESDLLQSLPMKENYFVQAFVPGNPEDLKVYVIGNEIFALRKAFSPKNFNVPGRIVDLRDDISRIARATRDALGLDIFGLDIVESDRGPFVVDVNYFPSFNGVPAVGRILADYILNAVRS